MAFTLNPSVTLPFGEGTQFTPNDSNGVVNYASGYIETDSGTAVGIVVPIGFHPRKIKVVNLTTLTIYELLDFMQTITANSTLKTIGSTGVTTLDTTGLITIGTDAAGTERTFTLAATLAVASSNFVFEATA
jgi:hypothetical protein